MRWFSVPGMDAASQNTTVSLRAGKARATVALRGAQALAWQAGGRDLLWTPDPAVWPDVSPLLFPVVGWTRGGQSRVDGRLYPLALHGFARHLDYAVLAQGADFVRLGIMDTPLTRALYPFAFRLEASYHLTEQGLEMSMVVVNHGDAPMPYACGFHPGFVWPFAGGAQENYAIVFDKPEPGHVPVIAASGLIGPTMRDIPLQHGRLALSPALFANDALCFLNPASTRLRFAGPTAAIDMALDNLAHMALWMRPGGRYLCLEAWSGHSDPEGFVGDLSQKPSMNLLLPGEQARHAVSYTFVA